MATLSEFHTDIKNRLSKLTTPDNLLLTLAREMYVKTSKRIFEDGILTSGAKIEYSNKPILAGASSFATKAGFATIAGSKEKRRKLKWVTVKSGAKLFEVAGGFKEIKKLSGKPNPFDFTGQLKKSYLYEGRKGESVLGFIDIKRKTPDGKPTSTRNEDIVQGLEKEKGEIFGLTQAELKDVDVIVEKYLDSIF